MARSTSKRTSSKTKGRMQLYDVRMIDTETGEIVDERRLDCSCFLFAHWWAGDWRAANGQPIGESVRVEISPQ